MEPKKSLLQQYLDERALRKHDKMVDRIGEFLEKEPHPAVEERARKRREQESTQDGDRW